MKAMFLILALISKAEEFKMTECSGVKVTKSKTAYTPKEIEIMKKGFLDLGRAYCVQMKNEGCDCVPLRIEGVGNFK